MSFNTYIETNIALQYVAETIKHYGYVKSNNKGDTKTRAKEFYCINNNISFGDENERDYIRKLMSETDFNYKTDYATEIATNALKWFKTQ